MKPFDEIKKTNGKIALIFEHGLGDFVNFLPVYHEFCEQVNKKNNLEIFLCSSSKRQFKQIYDRILEFDNFCNLKYNYSYIYKIIYPDPKNVSLPIEISEEPSKPYICAYYELGMKEFTWKPYKILNRWKDKNSKRIGVHLFGHTGMHKKFCPKETAEKIWNEIIEAGYKPFECHMTPGFCVDYPDFVKADLLSCIDSNCSLRFKKSNLGLLAEEIGKCKFFIGIDSGPIYLAASLLGTDYLIGLENQKKLNQFIPKHITTVSVNNYKTGTIYKQLKLKEDWL